MVDKTVVATVNQPDLPVEKPKLNRSVIKVVRLQPTQSGQPMPVVLYKSGQKGRRISSKYRGLHKRFVRLMEGHDRFIDVYKSRHHQSNARKKDGWMKDFRKNVSKAFRAGRKRAKVSFGFS